MHVHGTPTTPTRLRWCKGRASCSGTSGRSRACVNRGLKRRRSHPSIVPLTHTHPYNPCSRPAAQTALAHRGAARDVDFNRSKPYALVTCGEDRLVKFWDSRRPAAPVKHLAGHTHWCERVCMDVWPSRDDYD